VPFRKVDERVVHPGGRGLVTVVATFEDGAGDRFEREIIRHPGAVGVVPVLDDGRVVLVRQYRAAVERDLLEIPAGMRDVHGEPPEQTARRELIEEAGYEAASIELLSEYFSAVGITDERFHVYLATGLTECATDRQGAEEQEMTIEPVALAEVPGLVLDGTITDAKTIIGCLLAKERLGF
jgi:8-oxo-dGTP pyrophosphatase MutT (NUDIX family)